MAPLYSRTDRGLMLHLRVTPNGGRDAVDGPETRSDGTMVLRLRVRAQPEDGKANAAVIALLSKTLNVSKSAIAITTGQTGRLKTVLISGGDIEAITAALDAMA